MKNNLIAKAVSSLSSSTPKDEKSFLKTITDQIAEQDLCFFSPELLAEMASTHYKLAKKQKPGKAQIRIYSPMIEGQTRRKTIIDIVSDDLAFLVDSVAAEINKHNLLVHLLIHPCLHSQYDESGKLTNITGKSQKAKGYRSQSHIHIQVHETLSAQDLKSLQNGLHKMFEDVMIINRDWRDMLAQLQSSKTQLEQAKTKRPKKEISQFCDFLEYLYNGNFTLLGYREYKFTETKNGLKSKTIKDSGLGLLRDSTFRAYISETDEGLPQNLQELRRSLPSISISKTNRLSTVHRRVPMDAIAIKTYDEKGKVIGEKLFIGLFTSVTYSRSVSDVPYLREKVEDVVQKSEFSQGSHNRKALRHILEKYPRDDLFQINTDELYKISLNILRLQERQRIALFMRKDTFERYISCLVYVPRDRFGTRLRKRIVKILAEELNGTCNNFYISVDDSVYARITCIINVSQKNPPKYNADNIEKLLQDTGKTWAEKLSDALLEAHDDEEDLTNLTLKYCDAFPVSYTSHYQEKQAVFDIKKVETVLETQKLALELYQANNAQNNQIRLKVYHLGKPLTLSAVMPILENMGVRAVAELPFKITPQGEDQPVWIHDFELETKDTKNQVKITDMKHNFERAFSKTWYNETENDGLNKLVLKAGINWHEITILRAYVRYMKQIGSPFDLSYIERAITDNPKTSLLIVSLFKAYHNPRNADVTDELVKKCQAALKRKLEIVDSLDQDRILRTMIALVDATMRTNYYIRDEEGLAKPYLSLKFDSRAVPDLPEPKPFREVFVYSPRVEAIHLRGDKIARGGLRWSDRHEDFRTEVLGLMKAQMVKNSVIVPTGSKGGFVVKTNIQDRAQYHKEGVECYKTFIRGLLDITDNRQGKNIVPPANVVRRDGDDPYLVVAADKGTATFSDIANGLSQDYGFWLDDAFASGGSAGYDHKKMGITAKGAWESVKLHFRQLNHNTQEKDFDVVGIGDMGGDVFGNGMLLSNHIKLIGAFNHLHIFCDPDPDPETSFKERERLFKKIGGWDQYDQKKMSKGGMIFSRADKKLKLTPEIQERFDIKEKEVSPIVLIRAILMARTNLLWFGGIGTYIKASHENNLDAGDKTNDALRIDAKELRANVIGEGANLAITQLARIEFAQHGGKINSDFIDNSGGVDSSDHEVNIKILLTHIMSSNHNKMNLKTRNKLLASMTDNIADHVLRNNYQQAQAVSLTELQAGENLQIHNDFIIELEREDGLNREIEGLPNTEEIEKRLQTGKGLTRPELSILLSYAKIKFTQDLLNSDIPDNPDMQDWLTCYFPNALSKKYPKEISQHRLKREIIATVMANSLINRLGPTFLKSRMKKTGATAADIAKAYIIVRDAFNLRKLWDDIEALDNKVPAEVQLKAMRDIAKLSEHAITWFLTRLGRSPDISKDTKAFAQGISDLSSNLKSLVTKEVSRDVDRHMQARISDGIPKALARRISILPVLSSACDIVHVANTNKTNLRSTARTYFKLGEAFHLDWLRSQSRYLPTDTHWQAEAASGLIDQLYSCQAGFTAHILKDANGQAEQEQDLTKIWIENHEHKIAQVTPLFDEIRRAGSVDLSMLMIAEQRLRSLYDG